MRYKFYPRLSTPGEKQGVILNAQGITIKDRLIPWLYILRFETSQVNHINIIKIVVNRDINNQLIYEDAETFDIDSENYEYNPGEVMRFLKHYHQR